MKTLCSLGLGVLLPLVMGAASVEYIIQVSVDGLAANYLQTYVSNSPASFPTFAKMTAEGAFTFNARCDYDISETVPNHATMLTARPTSPTPGLPNTVHHGWIDNFPGSGQTFHNAGNTNLEYVPSVFDVTHDHGLRTAIYASKTRLGICNISYNAVNGAPDFVGEDNGRDKIDFDFFTDGSITTPVDSLLGKLNSTNPPNYNFLHLTEPDSAGHRSGWGTAVWSNAVRQVDLQLGRIFSTVTTNPLLSGKTAIIVTADHGGGGGGQSSHTQAQYPQNFTIPFFVWGPSVLAGTDAYTYFSNRHNPGTNRVTNADPNQPIRNGDGSNLVLALLGLPAIPGSFMIPETATSSLSLSWQLDGNEFVLSWPAGSQIYILEQADPAEAIFAWELVQTQPVEVSETFSYRTSILETPARLFRLRLAD